MEGNFLGINQETVLLFSIPIVLALIAIEVLVGSLKGIKLYNKDDTLGTVGMLIGNIATQGLTKGLSFAFMLYLYEFRLFNFSETLPPWLLLVAALFMIDLWFYLWHRANHRIRFLWAIHLSHHSSQEMNFSVAFRQPILAPLFKIPFMSILPLMGLDPSVIVVAGLASTFWGVIGHTQIIPRLGPIEWFFNTPSAHRVHHGVNPQYIDKNYANMFIIYDRILGTYAAEKETVVFGLVNNVGTNNPLTITSHVWKKMWEDLKTAQSLPEVCGYIFGPPDWQPKDKAQLRLKAAAKQG